MTTITSGRGMPAGEFVVFNWRRGTFQDKRLRTAAAHAIDREAIHHAVFYGHGAMADQPYPEGNRWHMDGIRSLEYDPERAKAMLKEARVIGTEVKLMCNANNAIHCETAQVVQDQWNSVGFKVNVEILDTVPWRQARDEGTFTASIQGNTFRYNLDDFFGRNLYSKSQYAKVLSGWQNTRYDQFIEEAKRTLDAEKRKALYTEGWNIVNVEGPFFYLHEVTQHLGSSQGAAGLSAWLGGCVGLPRRWLSHRLSGNVTRGGAPRADEALVTCAVEEDTNASQNHSEFDLRQDSR